MTLLPCPGRPNATPPNTVVFTIAPVIVRNGKIAEMDFLADPDRLAGLDLTILDGRD